MNIPVKFSRCHFILIIILSFFKKKILGCLHDLLSIVISFGGIEFFMFALVSILSYTNPVTNQFYMSPQLNNLQLKIKVQSEIGRHTANHNEPYYYCTVLLMVKYFFVYKIRAYFYQDHGTNLALHFRKKRWNIQKIQYQLFHILYNEEKKVVVKKKHEGNKIVREVL